MNITLHVGHPKCGTSTIQDFLLTNQKKMLDLGHVIADQSLTPYSSESSKRPPVKYFKDIYDTNDTLSFTNDINTLIAYTEQRDLKNIIISAENLSDIKGSKLFSELTNEYTLNVIYYIRPQADWLISAWKQWRLKMGHSLEEVISRHITRSQTFYKPVLEAWEEVVGRENIHLKLLDKRALTGGDLITDFCNALNLNVNEFESVEKTNFSFDYDFLRVLNQSPFLFDGPHDNNLYHYLETHYGEGLAQSKRYPLTTEQYNQIMDCHREENKWIQENYFKGKPYLEYLKPKKQQDKVQSDDFSGLSKMMGVQLDILMDLQKRLQKLERKN